MNVPITTILPYKSNHNVGPLHGLLSAELSNCVNSCLVTSRHASVTHHLFLSCTDKKVCACCYKAKTRRIDMSGDRFSEQIVASKWGNGSSFVMAPLCR